MSNRRTDADETEEVNLNEMRKDELISLAEEREVEITSSMTKAEIIAELEAADLDSSKGAKVEKIGGVESQGVLIADGAEAGVVDNPPEVDITTGIPILFCEFPDVLREGFIPDDRSNDVTLTDGRVFLGAHRRSRAIDPGDFHLATPAGVLISD